MSRIKKKIEDLHFTNSKDNMLVKMLKPLSYVYERLVRFRRDLYQKRLLKRNIAGCFTISVGNLTYGGTGKTPVVINLAEMLSKRGLRVGIVHSGYGSPQHKRRSSRRVVSEKDGAEIGDEATEIFVRAKDALVYSSRNRVDAIERAIFEGGINVCILDDAFQYLKVASDLQILVVDYFDRFGNEYCLPAGPMRESKNVLALADIIWFVSHRRCQIEKDIEKDFLSINNSLKFVYSRFKPEALIRVNDMKEVSIPTKSSKKVISFCGIGRDNRFIDMLSEIGVSPIRHLSFGDHHRYTGRDIERINMTAMKNGAEMVITTEKDYLRDTSILNKVRDLHIFRVNLEIVEGRTVLENLCDSLT
ncbi:MAG: tetraacyldisaccharide 4'-kinase [Deltaproteobacteria bacterium]|nr:tetraacyldisaccharide 4'-kinase [Deltaproteobacteria bacterium]